ncbi:hypothetical protein BGX38DRAFT_1284186 [Terfezia claveryi]|nr:hypothetical protein BGX38DRAFT_1284186 [Terfezia claveryi]
MTTTVVNKVNARGSLLRLLEQLIEEAKMGYGPARTTKSSMANPSQDYSSAVAALKATANEIFWQIFSTFLSLRTLSRQTIVLPTIDPNSLRNFTQSNGNCEFDPTIEVGLGDLVVRILYTLGERVNKTKAELSALPIPEDREEGEIDEELEKCENMVKIVGWLRLRLGEAALQVSEEFKQDGRSI